MSSRSDDVDQAGDVGQALDAYRRKRDFARTAEPQGADHPGTGRSFVVQKHAARRLHYDFRLELDGVLKSWAVTRGPSYDPADKRLAVRTEDHPLDYGGFEGTIPQGQYGGGTVMLWDRGDWRPLHDPHQGLKDGMLHFVLDGTRLKGEWSLVRMRPRHGEKRENWLLVKSRDGFAGAEPSLLADDARSVASGRTLAQIRDGRAPLRSRKAETTRPATAEAAKPPKPVTFQQATLVDAPPDGDDWLHEIKLDGYRAQLAIGGGDARLYSRGGYDWTDRFASLVTPALTMGLAEALVDGEVVVVLDDGRTDFRALQEALSHSRPLLSFFAFDLLRLDGRDLRRLPQLERKQLLAAALGERGRKGPIFYSDHAEGQGPAFLAAACARGLEGIVSKRADAPYRAGRGRAWLKTKCAHRQELVIGGWTPSTKAGRPFASLLLGWFDADGSFRYAGRVGTGFDEQLLADLGARLRARQRRTPAFADVPAAIARGARWVRPDLVAEIAYSEWTGDGRLRHPSFVALRQDKPAREVRRR